jgi:hypothetical protein
MSKTNHIKRAYEEKVRRLLKALTKDPITLSPEAAWVCIEEGIHPVDYELSMAEAQKKLHEFLPPTLSDGAAKLLTQADLDRDFNVTGPGNVVANAIALQNLLFGKSDPGTRGSLRAHNESLSERAVRIVIEGRNHCRHCRREKRNSDPRTRGSIGAASSEQDVRKAIKFGKKWEKLNE